MKKKKPNTKAVIFRGIPPRLKAKFKALCAGQQVTMQDKIIELMQNEIKVNLHYESDRHTEPA